MIIATFPPPALMPSGPSTSGPFSALDSDSKPPVLHTFSQVLPSAPYLLTRPVRVMTGAELLKMPDSDT